MLPILPTLPLIPILHPLAGNEPALVSAKAQAIALEIEQALTHEREQLELRCYLIWDVSIG